MPPLYETTLKCYFFLYPHFGHTPSLFKVTPHNGQRSILFFVSNSAEPALVNRNQSRAESWLREFLYSFLLLAYLSYIVI